MLQSLFKKKSSRKGVFGISFVEGGIAIAISNFVDGRTIKLIHCDYIQSDSSSLVSKLKQMVKEFNLSHYQCNIILAPTDYRLMTLEKPAVNDDEIKEALRWKIDDMVDYSVDDLTIDFYPLPVSERANQTEMIEVVATPTTTVQEYVRICESAKLDLFAIDIYETTLRNLADLLPENQRGIAVLYIQEDNCLLLIQKDGLIYIARKIEFGYQHIDGNNADYSVLALEIQRSLDYVESLYGMQAISGLAVIPIPENTQALLDMLNNNFGITSRIMDISAIVETDFFLKDSIQSKCAPVIGGTLRPIEIVS